MMRRVDLNMLVNEESIAVPLEDIREAIRLLDEIEKAGAATDETRAMRVKLNWKIHHAEVEDDDCT